MPAAHLTSFHAAHERSHMAPSLHVSRTCTTWWKQFHDMFDPTKKANYYKRRRWSAFVFLMDLQCGTHTHWPLHRRSASSKLQLKCSQQ